ncbi:MAG TPA: PaaI family thioesterase [Quisquiliibacterium sp.]|nr:PaaI family thioesterase [Quisquiliibacterium sp.]
MTDPAASPAPGQPQDLEPPGGFTRHFRASPLTAPWEPLYSKWVDDLTSVPPSASLVIGLRVREAHCNSRGFAHGGLIGALADNAMGLSLSSRASALQRAAVARNPGDTGTASDAGNTGNTAVGGDADASGRAPAPDGGAAAVRHAGSVTVNLNVDFVGSARIGDWLEFRPRVLKRARTLAFVDCVVVTGDDQLVARANATFRLG